MSSRDKEERKKYNRLYYIENKEKFSHRARLASSVSQATKTYTMVGKVKIVDLPANILDILHERFRVDETSKTGLRWSESSANQPYCRGKEVGSLTGRTEIDIDRRYYTIRFNLGEVRYFIGAARAIVMMVNNIIIDPALRVNHINKNTQDNRIVNLEVTTVSSNNVNCRPKGSCTYKNIQKHSSRSDSKSRLFLAVFFFLGRGYYTKYTSSEDHAAILGWELMTSGKVPLGYIKSQSDEWKDGTYLKKALAECKKQGIAVKRPKFKTLYEYIASVEGSC
jgi:hypothetical protein